MKELKRVYLFSCTILVPVFLMVLILTATAQSKSHKSSKIINNKIFLEQFEYYYKGLDKPELSVAKDQLKVLCKDIILYTQAKKRGSSGVEHRAIAFQKKLFIKLKQKLRKTNYVTDDFKNIVLDCLLVIVAEQDLQVNNSRYGATTGTLVQIINKVTIRKFLESEGFEEL